MIVHNIRLHRKPGEPLQLLYAEPELPASPAPVVDVLTRGMAAALNAAVSTGSYARGFHICSCGAHSDNTDYILPTGDITNSLAVHYLAYHRHELKDFIDETLAVVRRLLDRHGLAEAEPTSEQLQPPNPRSLVQLVHTYHERAAAKRAEALGGRREEVTQP